ncbi:hypothetical protein BH09BAC1_BH09BAC1_25120 [soil metagenome]
MAALHYLKFLLLTAVFACASCANYDRTDAESITHIPDPDELTEQVYQYNNQLQYDSSIYILIQTIHATKAPAFNKFNAYLNLSYTHKRLANYSKVFEYLDSALVYGLQTDSANYCRNQIKFEKALAYFDVQNYSTAAQLMAELQASHYQYLKPAAVARMQMQQGYLLYKEGEYEQATSSYDSALAVLLTYEPCDAPMIYGKQIQLLGHTRQWQKMLLVYNEAITMADSCGILKYEMYTNETMFRTYEEMGLKIEAYPYMRKYDSLEGRYDLLVRMDKLADAEKDLLNNENKRTIAIKQLEITRQRLSIYLLISIIIIIVVTVITITFWSSRRMVQAEKQMYMDFTKLSFQKTEQERKRIAADLHDSVSHELLILKSHVEIYKKELGSEVDGIINGIRIVSRNLHPVLFEQLGLQASLEQLVERTADQHNFLITTDISYQAGLPTEDELQVYRIVQEGITNMLKHANAIAGKLTIQEFPNEISIELRDNGKGFMVAEVLRHPDSFGLLNIIERSKAVAGKAHILSDSGGTIITIVIPKTKVNGRA